MLVTTAIPAHAPHTTQAIQALEDIVRNDHGSQYSTQHNTEYGTEQDAALAQLQAEMQAATHTQLPSELPAGLPAEVAAEFEAEFEAKFAAEFEAEFATFLGEALSKEEYQEAFSALFEQRFGELYLQKKNQMRGRARRMWQPHQDPEDLVQETFLRAWAARKQFKADSNVHAWMNRIMSNLYNDGWRKRANHERPFQGVDLAEVDYQVDYGGFADRELVMDVHNALAELPDSYREAIELIDLRGMTIAMASAHSGVPEGTLKSRRARAREILHGTLALAYA